MPRATSSVWTEKSTAWTETGDDRGGTAPAWLSVPMTDPSMLTDSDRGHLRRCVELAQAALEAGDEPFGSVLVDEHGTERFADRNRVAGGDATRHPEFAIARWAAANLTVEERADATVYTSGEHCPMCAAAHAWVGLGRIVYASSSEQLSAWLRDWGIQAGPVAPLPVQRIAPSVPVAGPDPQLSAQVRQLHARARGVHGRWRPPPGAADDDAHPRADSSRQAHRIDEGAFMQITRPSDCGKAPGIAIVGEFAAKWAAGEATAVAEWLTDDASWSLIGAGTHSGPEAAEQVIPRRM